MNEPALVSTLIHRFVCYLGCDRKKKGIEQSKKKNWKTFNTNYIVDVTDANGVYIDGNVIEILRYFRS